MKLLAIETATEACSAALAIDGEIEQRFAIAPREHASRILHMTDELMAEAGLSVNQLDAIAFGRGPGSFIGVRIAAGVTQGIAFAANLPVVPVSTLAAIAQGSQFDHLLVAIDARMSEIYFGQYARSSESGMVSSCMSEVLLPPLSATVEEPRPEYEWVGIGTGWQTYKDELMQRFPHVRQIDEQHFPSAKSVAQLAEPMVKAGQVVSPAEALPVYLRDQVAEKPNK